MIEPRQQSSGFSGPPKRQPSQQQTSQSPVDSSTKEQQALALINQGQLQAAEAIYRELIAAGTASDIVYGNLAALCGMQGRFHELIKLLRKALQLKPNNPHVHNNLGIALQQQGDLDAAIAAFNKALELKPNNPEALNNLGNALKQQGDLDAAIGSYNTALQIKPNYPEAYNNMGNALQKQGDLDAAIAAFNKALELKINNPDAHYNLGNALKEQGDLDAAIASYNTALKFKPNYPDAHNNLGSVLLEQGDLTAAIASYNQSLRLKPNNPEAHYNIGNALHEQGHLDAAIASYNTALQLKPNYLEAHWNSSLTMLLGGDYKKGWEKYEWRTKREKEYTKIHAFPKCDLWHGELAFKSDNQLLLVTEQGLGDTLQFMRYAIALRHQGISVSLSAQPKLHSLIQTSGIDKSPLTPEQANNISEGHWIPLLSVPKYLKVSPQNPIITQPYIKTTDKLSAKWRDILSVRQGPIIGINWRGNRKDIKKRTRDIPIQKFRRIVDTSVGSFLCLQRGAQRSEVDQLIISKNNTSISQLETLRVADSDEQDDFLEYAAIVGNCDLVITTGTSVAHISAGLGIPTWVLLPKVPDWRWGLEGDTTFWYPSMRLFRQRERGNWDEVIERVASALQDQFGND